MSVGRTLIFDLLYTVFITGAIKYAIKIKTINQSPLCWVQNGIVVKKRRIDDNGFPVMRHKIILAGIIIMRLGTIIRRNLCLYHFHTPKLEIFSVEKYIPIPESNINISTAAMPRRSTRKSRSQQRMPYSSSSVHWPSLSSSLSSRMRCLPTIPFVP